MGLTGVLTNFMMKYLNAFVFADGEGCPEATGSLAVPLWKSSSTHKTCRHVVINVVRGSSPLKTRWLYGSLPAMVPIVMVSVVLEFIAVLSNEQSIVSTSRLGIFCTRYKEYSEGLTRSEAAGI